MKRTAIIAAALLLVVSSAHASEDPQEQVPNGAAFTQTGDITLADDVSLEWGNTATAPDFWCEHDTSTTPDQWACSSTDIDGGGTDGRVFYVDDGTDDITFLGSIRGLNADGPMINNVAASDTVAVFIPRRSSPGSGVSSSATNRVDLISNGNDMFFVTTNSIVATATAATVDIRGNNLNSTASTAWTLGDDLQQTGMSAQVASTITVAAAATTWVATRNWQAIDCDAGGNTIATITRPAGVTGASIYCAKLVDASCDFTDTADGAANTIDLNGALTEADDVLLCLMHDSTSWHELLRQTGL